MSVILKTFRIDGVLTDMTSVKLSSQDGTYGVKRNDTGAVVVADGVSLTKTSTGVYQYEFEDPAYGLSYTFSLEVTYGGETYWITDTMNGPGEPGDSGVTLYYNYKTGLQVSSPEGGNIALSKIAYGDYLPVSVMVYSSGTTAKDLSEVEEWKASLDVDESDDTEPLVRVLNEDFDVSQVISGVISFTLACNTTSFYEEVTELKKGYLEIYGYDGDDNQIVRIKFRVQLMPCIDPTGDTPIEVSPGCVRSLNGERGVLSIVDSDGNEFSVDSNNNIVIPTEPESLYVSGVEGVRYDEVSGKWECKIEDGWYDLGGKKASTFTVAAVDSTFRCLADYICDGIDDDIQIQEALDALPLRGGDIELLDGTFNTGDSIYLRGNHISIKGRCTNATLIKLQAGANCDVFVIESESSIESFYFNTIKDLSIDGNKNNNTAGCGIVVNELDVHLESIFVLNTVDACVKVLNPWGCVIRDCVLEYGNAQGLLIDDAIGTEVKVSNCKISGNIGPAIQTNGVFGKFFGNYLSTLTPGEYIVKVEGNYNVFTGNTLTSMEASEVACYGVYLNGSNNIFKGNLIYGGVGGMLKAYIVASGKSGNICDDLVSVNTTDWLTEPNNGGNLFICRETLNNSGALQFNGGAGYKMKRITGAGGALQVFEIGSKRTDSAIAFNDGPYMVFTFKDNTDTEYKFVRITGTSYGGTLGKLWLQVHYDASNRYTGLTIVPSTSIGMAITDVSNARLKIKSLLSTYTTVNTATYDLLNSDLLLHVIYTTTGAVTINIPSAQTISERTITVKDAGGNAGSNNITIVTEASQKIDGVDTYVINTEYDSITLYSDGINWFTKK